MPYRNSPLNPRAGKPGKKNTTTVQNRQKKDVEVESSTLSQVNFAVCSQGCGSLGGYLDPRDARNAETMHRKTAHPDVNSVDKQKNINKNGPEAYKRRRG